MILHNFYYNTFPLITHNPFTHLKDCNLWNKIIKIPIKIINLHPDVTIVTWNSGKKKGMLELQLDKYKIKHICFGKDFEWKTNREKQKLLIKNFNLIKTKYILGMDCFDVFINYDLINLICKFKNKNAKLIYNATGTVYPYSDFNKKIESELCPPPFCYFNSGLFFGESEYLMHILSLIDWNDKEYFYSDQHLIRKMYHRFYPDVQIDWNCEIFQIGYLKYPNPPIENYLKLECMMS